MPKLTLSVDEQVIRDAKVLAQRQGTSVSALFERLIRSVTLEGRGQQTPITEELSGVVQLPPGKDYEDILEEALLEKHAK